MECKTKIGLGLSTILTDIQEKSKCFYGKFWVSIFNVSLANFSESGYRLEIRSRGES